MNFEMTKIKTEIRSLKINGALRIYDVPILKFRVDYSVATKLRYESHNNNRKVTRSVMAIREELYEIYSRILRVKIIRNQIAAKVFGEDVINAVTKSSMLDRIQVSDNVILKATIKADVDKIYFEILRTF